jgi:fructuronate reductase/mannitol 2-dehydrogenase
VRDPRGAELQALAIAGGDLDPRPLLGERSIFGDLGGNPCFVDAVAAALGRLERDGVRPTIAAYTSRHVHPAPGEASGASA